MKEIIAIIRPECAEPTKDGLEAIGVKGVTFISVTGRGRQRGTIRAPDPEGTLRREIGVHIMHHRGLIDNPEDPKYHEPVEKEIELGFLPKKMFMIAADDTEVPAIVSTIIKLNRSEHQGDGRIFVCPMNDAVRIRTGERGSKALL
jgi:nitrogen regulatory protein PII 2